MQIGRAKTVRSQALPRRAWKLLRQRRVVHFVLLLCAVAAPGTAGDEEFADRELEAFPRVGLEDAEISACFTRVFREDLLPHLGTSIPELGIHSIDPVIVPNVTFTFLDIGDVRWIVHVPGAGVRGAANMSRSDIGVDTQGRRMSGHLDFPRIEGRSVKTNVEGHVFGIPMAWFTQEVGISFRIDGLSSQVSFKLRPTTAELFRLDTLQYDVAGFVAQAHDITRPAWIDTVVNWFMRRFGLQFFQYVIRPGFHGIFTNILNTFMDPKVFGWPSSVIFSDIKHIS